MFGMDEWIHDKMKGLFEKSMNRMNAYEIMPPKLIKAFEWTSEKFIPFLTNVTSFVVLVWIFNRIYMTIGFEKVVVFFLCIFLSTQKWK